MSSLMQARNQLTTPGVAKSFLRGVQVFSNMSNSLQLCLTDFFQRRQKIFQGGEAPLLRTWFNVQTCEAALKTYCNSSFIRGVKYILGQYAFRLSANLPCDYEIVFDDCQQSYQCKKN